jgi:hypothetical protein
MPAQLALAYPASYVGGEVWRQRIEVLRSAVNHLGLKEVAYTLDVAGSQLSDSLNERDRKRWAGEWLDVLKAMLVNKRDEIATDLLRRLLELDVQGTGFALVEDEPLSPEQEAAELRRELAKFGDAGKAAVERVKKRGRR